jgi:undecaprenyl pyrophosphate phosphatase UppP
MSVPPIAGAALLEIVDALKESAPAVAEVSWGLTIYGAALAAVVGYFALALLLRSLRSDRFWLFGPYCVVAGVVAIACC